MIRPPSDDELDRAARRTAERLDAVVPDDWRTGDPLPTERPARRRELRARLVARARGRCEWPACGDAGEHMAHIDGIGMGGRASADRLSNVALLCRFHHDVLDGRTISGRARAVRDLLAAWINR